MSNDKGTIEYYKSELVKKDEIIESLFEEVDNLKDTKQKEQREIFKNFQNKERIWKSREEEFKKELKDQYNDLQNKERNWKSSEEELENQLKELKVQCHNLQSKERIREKEFEKAFEEGLKIQYHNLQKNKKNWKLREEEL